MASPSSIASESSGERRPSLPYFSEDSVRKQKRNSLRDVKSPAPSTPKDELQFLKEITGGEREDGSKDVRKNLFNESSSSSDESTPREKNGNSRREENMPSLQNKAGSFSTETTARSSASDLGGRLGGAIISSNNNLLPDESEEKTEVEPLSYGGPGFEEKDDASNGHTGSFRDSERASQPAHTNDRFDLDALRNALHEGDQRSLVKVLSKRDLPTRSQSFASSQLTRSSSYQLHFGGDNDDEVVPDDDFLNDDWDE